jgi:PIN domain nuclease of toxin-antitoxin system
MLRFLLDTNALVRRITEPKRLSREQTRILDYLDAQNQSFAISDMTLLELALKLAAGAHRIRGGIQPIFDAVAGSSRCQVLPVTIDIVLEISSMGDSLRDPADRAIVATARIHNLKLLTSDRRIIDSGLVPVIA